MSRNIIYAIIFSMLLFSGCSGVGMPVMLSGDTGDQSSRMVDIPTGSVVRGDASLGVWEVAIDLNTLKADYNMMRGASAVGQSLPECLLNNYLTVTPCSTCMRMDVVKLDPLTNRLTLSIGIRHPLPPYNPGFPINAQNRADLDVFNVMGIIIMPKALDAFNYLINGTEPIQADPFTMVNPDGFTHSLYDVVTDPTFMNPCYAEPISNLNPFKYYFSTSQNRRFSQGEPFQMIDYTFDTSRITNLLRFYIAFRASYGQSASFALTIQDPAQPGSRGNPKYYLPEFNQVDSYDLLIEQDGELEWKNTSSSMNITVSCKDYQSGKTGLGRFIMIIDPLDAISFTSDVEKVILDIPALTSTPLSMTTPTSGTGTELDPYLFTFNVLNSSGLSFGTYPFFAIVEDNRMFDAVDSFQIGYLQIPYIDDFDPFDGSIGWEVLTFRGDGWAVVNVGSPNDQVWDESNGGQYGDEDSTRLTSPVIDLTYSTNNPYIEITHSYETEFLWDGGAVFLSLDGGASFDYTKSIPIIGGKGYDSVLAGTGIADTVLLGKWSFTGSSGGEVSTQFDLKAAAHKSNVCVQFVFESNHFTSEQGWEIKNIKVIP